MKVLIADDSCEVRERIKILLSEVEKVEMIGEAENVQQAIEHIRQQGPDVVILDIQMPGGNGIDVLREIEKKDRVPMVIMLTNYPYPQYREKCKKMGADYFIDKMAEIEKLPGILEALEGKLSGKDVTPDIKIHH